MIQMKMEEDGRFQFSPLRELKCIPHGLGTAKSGVAPLAGARIEINCCNPCETTALSPLSQGRELKLLLENFPHVAARVAPLAGARIEIQR